MKFLVRETAEINGNAKATQRGVALIELVIALPLLLLVASGLIDLGLAMRDAQVISNAARQAGRTASLVGARQHPSPSNPLIMVPDANCRDDVNVNQRTCDEILTESTAQRGVDFYAKRAACESLADAKTSQRNWDVSVSLCQKQEDTISLTLLKTQIRSMPGEKSCALCFTDFLTEIEQYTSTAFFVNLCTLNGDTIAAC